MILAAADYANEDIADPPLELKYAWQSHTYNALPNDGGLRNQPAGLLLRMSACYNAWYATSQFKSADFDPKWIKNNGELWKIIAEIETLRGKLKEVHK